MVEIAKPLRVLLVEDNTADAELIVREIRRAGFEPEFQRVDTEADYLSALEPNLDIVLSDYSMPGFSGLRALDLLRERKVDIPFIIVSGTIGEEMAVAAMRAGAVDYLLKDRLARLGQAITQALEQRRVRRERQQAQETLDRLRHHHELILESAGEGILGVDLEGNVVFENPKAAELLGWKPSELLGRPFHATIHQKHANGSPSPVETSPVHASLRDGGERRITNDVFWRKNGSTFRVNLVAAPIKDKRGRITGGIVTFSDVTDQFVAQMRLKLQEEQYRLLFESNPSPMWVYDTKNLQILAVNDAAIAQYGYTREEFLDLTLFDLRFPEDRTQLEQSLTKEPGPTHFSGEFRHRRKDGSGLLVEIYSGATVWTGVAARIVTAIDITERRRAEERLRDQANIIDRARDAIIIRDFADRKIVFWNHGAEQIYGWPAREVVGRTVDELFADPGQIEKIVATLLATGEFRGELNHFAKDGRPIILDVRATLIRGEDGSPRSILSIGTDVTAQKELETQLLRAQRLESIGTLASGVAHDLNNILTPILTCAQTLREGVTGKDLELILSLIEGCARRGANVVKQVLTFARGIEGKRVLINPSHLIDEMLDIAQHTFPKSIEIRSDYPEDLWSVETDPTQIHQVLLNLAVNARDAMPNGGSLVLGAENFTVDEKFAAIMPGATPGPHVMLRVADTGTGMSQATLDKIFDPFFSTKEIGKGTGLGLSTALGIVKSHGGFISVQSQPESGTTFKIFLPAKAGDENQTAPQPSASLPDGDGELILAVDDEESILKIIEIILEKHGFRVITARNGKEALALFAERASSIDAVLTDVMMPHMDGLTLIRELKKGRPDLRIIASAGQGDDAHAAELESMGVDHFLSKPYEARDLVDTVREVLAGR